ncbi:hypothetical protein ABZS61_07375 [Streptomyces sp. NPDC005566]|uniref:hypothetical protein n=1 Tax=Streptomyces sp. NPDC005566 TaxID=3156886 RepID=UPI0033A8C6B3
MGSPGGKPGVLSALSRDTETFTVATNGVGLDTFGYWREGRCVESFEVDDPGTAQSSVSRWRDTLRSRREAAEGSNPTLLVAVRMICDHMGSVLEDATLDGPLPTVLVADEHAPRVDWSGRGRGRGVAIPLSGESGPVAPPV